MLLIVQVRRDVLLLLALISVGVFATGDLADPHRAPADPPEIDREDWCVHGMPTRTTGECMCRWSNKDACQGSACRFEYGLAWHHYTCLDCSCLPKPRGFDTGNNLRAHMANGTPVAKRLFELKSLLDLGLITEEDHAQRKAEILQEVRRQRY